MSQIDSKDKK